MDNSWEKSLRGDRSRSNSRKSTNPSFSSTLLDAIYRSIDEGEAEAGELVTYKETMRKKQSRTSNCGGGIAKEYEERERRSYHHKTEKWTTTTTTTTTEKKVNNSTSTIRRASDYDCFRLKQQNINPVAFHSASSSSDSSYGGFSSSEAESVYGGRRASVMTAQRPKPVRTCPAPVRTETHPLQKKAQTSTLEKSKMSSRSSPLSYSDLKKAKKLPVSPGAKLASFLNSLFAATGAAKKAKLSASFNGDDYMRSSERKSKSTQATSSTCSTASSYSRSCLSKTPSSTRGKSANGVKRSVRFDPVSVIVDEDCRPCGQKSLCEDGRSLAAVREGGDYSELKFRITEKNKRVEEAAKKFLNGSYQSKGDFLMRDLRVDDEEDDQLDEEEEEEEDDAASDSSSDLFELENLTAIGIERYREELPVYETTHLVTNRAIASGLIL